MRRDHCHATVSPTTAHSERNFTETIDAVHYEIQLIAFNTIFKLIELSQVWCVVKSYPNM